MDFLDVVGAIATAILIAILITLAISGIVMVLLPVATAGAITAGFWQVVAGVFIIQLVFSGPRVGG